MKHISFHLCALHMQNLFQWTNLAFAWGSVFGKYIYKSANMHFCLKNVNICSNAVLVISDTVANAEQPADQELPYLPLSYVIPRGMAT